MIFGHTDLRIGQSEAKVDAESDFEVRLPAGAPNPVQKLKKHTKNLKKVEKKMCPTKKMKLVPNESPSSENLIGPKDGV